MKKIFLLLILFCLPVFAQQDIRIFQTGLARTLVQNGTWAGTGPGALSNNYIYTPTPNSTGACVAIQNNDSSNHSISIGVWGTGNSSQQVPFGSTHAAWYPLPTALPSGTPQVLASSTQNFFAFYSGSAQVAIIIAGTSGTGTASIFVVETTSGIPCQGGPINVFGGAGPGTLLACDKFAQATAAPGVTTSLVAPGTGLRIVVCGFTATVATALTGNGFSMISGSGATCATSPATLWGPFDIGVAVGSLYPWGGATGQVFPAAASGNRLCVTSGASAGTVDFNVWYSQIP